MKLICRLWAQILAMSSQDSSIDTTDCIPCSWSHWPTHNLKPRALYFFKICMMEDTTQGFLALNRHFPDPDTVYNQNWPAKQDGVQQSLSPSTHQRSELQLNLPSCCSNPDWYSTGGIKRNEREKKKNSARQLSYILQKLTAIMCIIQHALCKPSTALQND